MHQQEEQALLLLQQLLQASCSEDVLKVAWTCMGLG
jgi:hypothetical protein